MAHLGFGERIRQLLLDYGSQIGERVTLARFGEEVAAAEEPRRAKPYGAQAVSEWIQERAQPSIRAFLAMEAVTGESPEYLMLGRGARRLGAGATEPPPPRHLSGRGTFVPEPGSKEEKAAARKSGRGKSA